MLPPLVYVGLPPAPVDHATCGLAIGPKLSSAAPTDPFPVTPVPSQFCINGQKILGQAAVGCEVDLLPVAMAGSPSSFSLTHYLRVRFQDG